MNGRINLIVNVLAWIANLRQPSESSLAIGHAKGFARHRGDTFDWIYL